LTNKIKYKFKNNVLICGIIALENLLLSLNKVKFVRINI
jgi:hypothetical protein